MSNPHTRPKEWRVAFWQTLAAWRWSYCHPSYYRMRGDDRDVFYVRRAKRRTISSVAMWCERWGGWVRDNFWPLAIVAYLTSIILAAGS